MLLTTEPSIPPSQLRHIISLKTTSSHTQQLILPIYKLGTLAIRRMSPKEHESETWLGHTVKILSREPKREVKRKRGRENGT